MEVKSLKLAALGTAVVALVLILLWPILRQIHPKRSAGSSNPPITLRFVQSGEFHHDGEVRWGTTFWATNHTSNTVAVTVDTIEVKVRTNWIAQRQPSPQPLTFQRPSNLYASQLLQPHEAAYATIQLAGQPTNGIWRLKTIVQPALSGFEDSAARVKTLVRDRRYRFPSAGTNAPTIFSKRVTFFGVPAAVLTQEISEE